MKTISHWLTVAAAGALLSVGLAARANDIAAAVEAPGTIVETCEAVLDSLRRTEAVTGAAIAAVHEQRREAEKLRDWFGYEMFGPYVSVLREQERVLEGGLSEIGRMGCGANFQGAR